MSQIIYNETGGKIIFGKEDFLRLLPDWATSTTLNQVGTGLSSMRSMNPFRSYPYALPGFVATDVTNVAQVTSFIRNGVVNGSSAYLVSSGALIHELTGLNSTPAITNAGSFPQTTAAHGGHSAVAHDDCIIYTAKVGGTSATRFLYSWNDNTDWDVGIYDFATTFDNDFMSTAPATPLASPYLASGVGKPHPMIIGEDDICYIGDRNFLHAYDGQSSADNDGKFFPAVLTLPNGLIISSFAKIPSGLMIFTYLENPGSATYYSGRTTAWLWNYNDLDITRSYDLNDNFVSEAFEYQGTVGCFTQGRSTDPTTNKQSKLQMFDGTRFVPIASFNSNVPIRGGVDIVGNAIYFNAAGILHAYGSPLLGTESGLMKLAEGAGTTTGFLKSLTSTFQLISSGATTSGGLQYFSAGANDYYHQTSFSTGLAEPIFPARQKGRITNVKVRFGKTSSGGRNFHMNLTSKGGDISEIISNSENLTAITTSNIVLERVVDTSDNPFITFDALKIVGTWGSGSAATDAPALSLVEVEYENVNLT